MRKIIISLIGIVWATIACAQPYGPGSQTQLGLVNLYNTANSVGNGADVTEDILQTFVVPAGKLTNVGDRLIIEVSGTLGATTDNKSVRIRLNGAVAIGTFTVSAAAQVAYSGRVILMKSGANTQAAYSLFTVSNVAVGGNGTPSVTDTAAITITVTGQNITNSVAGSIICRFMTVDFIP